MWRWSVIIYHLNYDQDIKEVDRAVAVYVADRRIRIRGRSAVIDIADQEENIGEVYSAAEVGIAELNGWIVEVKSHGGVQGRFILWTGVGQVGSAHFENPS